MSRLIQQVVYSVGNHFPEVVVDGERYGKLIVAIASLLFPVMNR